MLVLGSYNTINSKTMFQTVCPTLPSGHHLFNKPWLTNLVMFSGEASLLIPHSVRNWRRRSRCQPDTSDLSSTLLPRSNDAPLYIFAIPACCDVLGTGIGMVAVMFIDAAVWQMLRGSIIVFTAVLSVVFLKRKLSCYHWVGVGLTVVGLLLVGVSAVLEEPHDASGGGNASLGVMLVIFAQIFSAFQGVFEEYLLTGYEASAMFTVGMEGVWGIGLMAVLLSTMTSIPGKDHGVYESIPDGVHMVRGSGIMQVLMVTSMLSIAFYNYVGMQLCRKLSAVTRCLVDCMRTVVVWGFQLVLYYGVSKDYGHPWTEYSPIQVLGFCFLIFGTLVYNRLLKIPTLSYSKGRLALPVLPPLRVLEATWSPTVNRAAAWGWGPGFGPHSPAGSPPQSPLPGPFGVAESPQDSDNDVGNFHLSIVDTNA
eukprot:TRINITY_DN30392_c0_g1_i1.p1 TRINITY_DN30392_c0_g1~~TRINITY_DN30392_c0_g1_i1.p1  ORF type:complete len:450 (+),score=36.91 TRINITY_DN30392_c0_g1_i1:84-1352(+)